MHKPPRYRLGHANPLGPRTCWVLFATVVIVALAIVGCQSKATPTPQPIVAPTATASPSPTVEEQQQAAEEATATPTEVPATVAAQVFPDGVKTPVPIIYQMYDFGTDFQNEKPELGPVGSIHWSLWRNINPESGVYNWKPIDDKLASEANLKVTLADGSEIPKPVVLQIMAYISSAPGWSADFYDGTPRWVYDQIDRQYPDNPRPIVGGMKVGYALKGCGKTAVVPMYNAYTWQKAYFDLVRAFGERYDGHPQVAAVVICTGLDGETQVLKDWSCQWNAILDAQAPDARYGFTKVWKGSMDVYHEAFPNTPLFINNAPGGSGMRKATSDYAATFDPPIGLKNSGLWVDLDSHKGYGNFYGLFDMIDAYSQTLPIWLESVFGMGSAEHRYWTYLAGLHYHPDAIDCHPEFLEQSDPEWLRFTVAHLGVDINTTPDVWVAMRDSEYELQDWGTGGVSGHPGDWTFYMTRNEDAPQSATQRLWREELPAAQDSPYSRQARKTIQDEDQLYMSFDIDDDYPYVGQRPVAAGGNAHFVVEVTILNTGSDTFALQYRNWEGGMVSQTRRKGPSLGKRDDWVTVSFVVDDAYLDDNMPGGMDFRISCERDGDEIIHMVLVRGGWGSAPTPTFTPLPTITLTPSNTPTPTPTGPTPTYTPTATPRPPPPAGTLAPTLTPYPQSVRFDPADDTFLDQWAPSQSWDEEQTLSIRKGNAQAPLFRFDLSSIPASSRVESAVFQFCTSGRTNVSHMTVSLHRVLTPWEASEANWTYRTEDDRWTVAGCQDPIRDRSELSLGDIRLAETNYWYDVDLTDVVQAWVNDPDSNHGMIMQASGSASVQYDIYASEHPWTGQRPRLLIQYIPISPTPTRTATPATPLPTPTASSTFTPGPSPTQTSTSAPTATPTITWTPSPTPLSFTLRNDDPNAQGQLVIDTFLDEWSASQPQSESDKLRARQGGVRLPLMKFDVDSLPVDASIKSATLHLYTTGRSNPAPITLSVVQLKRSWDEEVATWVQATALEAWAQLGARDTDLDRGSKAFASQTLSAGSGWNQWDLTYLVQEWSLHPEENHGLALVANGPVSVEYDFGSGEWTEAFQPYLEVAYIPIYPSPTPLPTDTPTITPIVPTATVTPMPAKGGHEFQQGVDGYDGYVDTYIDEWNPRRNNVSSNTLIIRQGGIRSVLMRLQLDAVPTNSKIKQARLGLWVRSKSGPHVLPISAYQVLSPWDPEQATYQRADNDHPWCQDGALGPDCDVATTPAAETRLTETEQWIVLDITDLVQHWVMFPEENHGLLIRAGGSVAVEWALASSEWDRDTSLRPRLYVDWEPAPPTPTITGTPPTPTATLTPTHTPTNTLTPTPTRQQVVQRYQQGVRGYDGCADTYLSAWNQEVNFGQTNRLNVRQNGVQVSLLRFDISPAPERGELMSAQLNLWIAGRSNKAEMPVKAYVLRTAWDEDGANWLQASDGTLWIEGGAGASPGDHEAEPLASITLDGSDKWVSLDVTRAIGQWLESPEDNHGILLVGGGGVSVEYVLASGQWKQPKERPELVLNYELVPESGVSAEDTPSDGLAIAQWLALGLAMAATAGIIGLLLSRRRTPTSDAT